MSDNLQLTLEAARINAGYTQKELAKIMGKSEGTIISWEKGRSSMKVKDFKKICSILNVDESLIFFKN